MSCELQVHACMVVAPPLWNICEVLIITNRELSVNFQKSDAIVNLCIYVITFRNVEIEIVKSTTIVCSRSVGRGLRAEVYVMVECSYFGYTSRLTVCMPIEMYGESWIAGLLTSDDVMLYMAGFETTRGI